jgi:glucose-6-phosphate isomerase
MKQRPFTLSISISDGTLSEYDNHIVRHLSAMKGQFLDEQAYRAMLSQNPVFYEAYEIKRCESAGELMHGISIVHTKGRQAIGEITR